MPGARFRSLPRSRCRRWPSPQTGYDYAPHGGWPPTRSLKIGLYSPFFGSTFGGGEKYLGTTAEALRDAFPDAEIEILSPVPVDVQRYESMLGLDLSSISLRASNPQPGRLRRQAARLPLLRKVRDLVVSGQSAAATAGYDLLLSMVYVLPAMTRARRSVILCQFPYDLRGVPRWYRVTRRALLGREYEDFEMIICQSEYVRGWVRTIWDRDSLVVNPPIEVPDQQPDWGSKGPVVLSVGRFFASGHNKRHDLMAQAFRDLCDAGCDGWELHLVGSLHRSYVADVEYFERVCRLADGYPIHIHVDAARDVLLDLYQRASIYWHAAGYGVDAAADPAAIEHFGMTTVEAMGHGVVPLAIAQGGQVEVVEDGVSGFLWKDPDDLRRRTVQLMRDDHLRRRMGEAARKRSTRFARPEFERRMVAALEPIVRELREDLSGRHPAAVS